MERLRTEYFEPCLSFLKYGHVLDRVACGSMTLSYYNVDAELSDD